MAQLKRVLACAFAREELNLREIVFSTLREQRSLMYDYVSPAVAGLGIGIALYVFSVSIQRKEKK